MAYVDLIGRTPAQLANITDEVTQANAAYMQAQASQQIVDIVAHLERPGFLPRAILTENFTQGDGALLNWTVVSGTWNVVSNQLSYAPVLPSAVYQTITRLTQPIFNSQSYELLFHIDVTAMTAFSGSIRLEFRRLDTNSYYYLRLDPAGSATPGITLRKIVAGVGTDLDVYTVGPATNPAVLLALGAFDIRVVMDFASWQVWVNNIQTHVATDLSGWFDRGAVGISARDVNFTADNYILTSWIDGV